MTEGNPVAKITTFAFPMLLGNIAQQLYSTVDSIVVGQYVGDNALAAVGAAMPIINILFVLFFGVSSGVSVLVAQYVGARNRLKLSETIGTAMLLSLCVTILIGVLGNVIARPMLRLLNTPEVIFGWCESYLRILCTGYIGSIFYFMITGILRGMGDSFSALIYLLIATVLNIVLDIWFVASFNMGVAGVAYATILAQFISAVFCLAKLFRLKDKFDFKLKYFRFTMTKDILRLGLPTGLTQAIMSLTMVLLQSLTNSFGETIIAANVVIMRVDSFAMLPNMTFGVSMTTYVGQNLGAGKMDRIRDGVKKGTLVAAAVSAVMVSLILIFSKYLIMLFTDTEQIISLCSRVLRVMAVGYVAIAFTQCLQGSMRGAGNTITPMWISIVTMVLIRVPVAYGIRALTVTAEAPNGSYWCIFVSLLVTWILGSVITLIAYNTGKWRIPIYGDKHARKAQA